MIDSIVRVENFLPDPQNVFTSLLKQIVWDERMTARKTASYGVAYNYSQISYPFQPMLPLMSEISAALIDIIGFVSNNCLVNYYANGKSKMGFHADQIDILEANTGIAIVSLGQTRTLRFRNVGDRTNYADFDLHSGSLFYMTQTVQKEWEHAIMASDVDNARISLTFRKIIV